MQAAIGGDRTRIICLLESREAGATNALGAGVACELLFPCLEAASPLLHWAAFACELKQASIASMEKAAVILCRSSLQNS